jgi:hypothetical protein
LTGCSCASTRPKAEPRTNPMAKPCSRGPPDFGVGVMLAPPCRAERATNWKHRARDPDRRLHRLRSNSPQAPGVCFFRRHRPRRSRRPRRANSPCCRWINCQTRRMASRPASIAHRRSLERRTAARAFQNCRMVRDPTQCIRPYKKGGPGVRAPVPNFAAAAKSRHPWRRARRG